jgi:Protein of unknown function (DUF3052)
MPGYSGTPLAKKLGIKQGYAIHAVGAPPDYHALLEPMPEGVRFETTASTTANIVHLFETERARLAKQLIALRKKLSPDAAVWVSWPKKASKVRTTITEDTIREVALPLGFVDVKVCAVTDVWSGLKLVIRKELR